MTDGRNLEFANSIKQVCKSVQYTIKKWLQHKEEMK
jgi:hypothetical protein